MDSTHPDSSQPLSWLHAFQLPILHAPISGLCRFERVCIQTSFIFPCSPVPGNPHVHTLYYWILLCPSKHHSACVSWPLIGLMLYPACFSRKRFLKTKWCNLGTVDSIVTYSLRFFFLSLYFFYCCCLFIYLPLESKAPYLFINLFADLSFHPSPPSPFSLYLIIRILSIFFC